MPNDDLLAFIEKLDEIVSGTAKDASEKASDVPDDQTKEGMQEEKTEEKKAMTATRRAEHFGEQLIKSLRESIDRLASENELKNTRNANLERDLSGFSAVKEELASLKSPHKLRKAIIAGCSFLTVVGGLLVAAYPQGSNRTLLSLNADTLFGSGICFIFVSAAISLIIGLKG